MALKIKTYNNVQANVTFSKASSRVAINPTAGEAATENIALTLGKISKWYEALVPTGGSSGKILAWNTAGTAKWSDPLHPTITKSADTTSTASPTHGGTFTTVDTVTRDAYGHVTKINTKTVTLPADSNTDTKVTQSETTTTNYRPIVFGATNSTDTSTLAATITDQAYVSTLLYAQPQNGMLHANIFEAGKAGTTDGEIKFYRSGSGNSGEITLKAKAQSTSGTYLLPDCGNGTYTLSCGHEDLSAPSGSLSAANVLIPSYTKFIKIVFKSDSSATLYSMVEIPYFGNGHYSALVQVGTFGDNQGSLRIVMKAVIIQITDGTQTGRKSFTITGSPTTKINGSSVSDYTRNITIHKIYAVD